MISRKVKPLSLPVLFCIALALVLFQMPAQCQAYDIEIDVSPNVLNIQSQSTVVTVHTDIAYSLVVGSTVTLNDVEINYWKSDDRGNFVAKFLSEEIKTLDGLIIDDYNKLVLFGYTADKDAFVGMQDILVIMIRLYVTTLQEQP